MDSTSAMTSTAPAGELPTTNGSPCSLDGLPEAAHHYIHALQRRIESLETALANSAIEQNKSRERARAFGKILFNGPAKMIIGVLPKDMQNELEGFLNGN